MDASGSCIVEDRDTRTEKAILGLLLDFERGGMWSVEEVVSHLSASRLDVVDGLARLHAVGLIHRVDEFVFATRSASSFARLDL
jgi:hypothetical protein